MAEAAHLLRIASSKDVAEMADAEPHLGPECGREQLARNFGHIDRRWRFQAIVAIAAALGWIVAEMTQQHRAAAQRSFDEPRECIQPLAFAWAAARLDLLLDPLPGASEILRGPEQPRFGGFSIAAGAAGLLVISLDAFGDRGMGDQTHIRLVDAHAERHGRC